MPDPPPPTALARVSGSPTLEVTEAGDAIIKRYMLWAMGCGFIPSAVVDMAAVTVIEVLMIQELAAAYGEGFPRGLVSAKVGISLLGSIAPIYASNRLKSTVKAIPGVGHFASASLLVVVNAASVYAVGKVFQKHFASGGTFLSTDNVYLQGFFEEKLEEGRKLAPTLVAST